MSPHVAVQALLHAGACAPAIDLVDDDAGRGGGIAAVVVVAEDEGVSVVMTCLSGAKSYPVATLSIARLDLLPVPLIPAAIGTRDLSFRR